MLKVKIFDEYYVPSELERKVNEFIKSCKVVDVRYSTAVKCDKLYHSAMVIYNDT